MSKILVSIAALGLMGAASLPLPANAAERHDGVEANAQQSTEVSAQRRWRRHYGYLLARAAITVRATAITAPGPYYGYGYPYGYYRPGIGVGIGPFGFRVF